MYWEPWNWLKGFSDRVVTAALGPKAKRRRVEERTNERRNTHTNCPFCGPNCYTSFHFFVSFLFHSVGRKISFFFFFLRSSLFFWHARPHRLFSKALTRHLNKRFLSFLFLVTLKLFRFYFWLLLISNSQCFRPTVALAVNCWQVLQSLKPFFFFSNRRVRALLATVPHQECINNSAPALKYTHPFKSSRHRNTKEKKINNKIK